MTLFNFCDGPTDICLFHFSSFARKYFWLIKECEQETWAKWHAQIKKAKGEWTRQATKKVKLDL